MTSKFVVVLCLCFAVNSVQCARILGVFPLPGKSHYFLGSALMRQLAEQGHDVTVISPFGEKNPPKRGSYRDVLLSGMLEELESRRDELNMYEMGDINPFLNIPLLAYIMSDISEMTLKHENVQKLIKSGENFDAVIVEQFYNDAHKGLATHFKAPLILFSTIGGNFWVNPLVGNPAPPSYVPDTLLSYSEHMSFCERLTNSLIYLVNQLVHHLYLFPKHNRVMKQYIPNVPDIGDIIYNNSIVLLNSHPSLNQPIPLVPNMIQIGGFHVKPPKKLPEDLQNFLDNAKEGVIYFSMGSNLRSIDMPKEKREALVKSFSKLKEKVLWKWEEDFMPDQPPNVKLGKWLPQQDILAHPNLKLFITHGGLLSTTETIYHGVPILTIPIYADQKMNAKIAVNNGYGLCVPFKELNEELVSEKLHELLTNPRYSKTAKTRSKLFHDRQVKPMDTAVYWVEYVIRHKGAPHLRIAGLDLPWYKYHLLDVITFVTAVILAVLLVVKTVLKIVCRKFCTAKKQDKMKKS